MVEVFKTNVQHWMQAASLLDEMREAFPLYRVNFDLEDCDRILRVEHARGDVETNEVQKLFGRLGFEALPLPEESAVPTKHLL